MFRGWFSGRSWVECVCVYADPEVCRWCRLDFQKNMLLIRTRTCSGIRGYRLVGWLVEASYNIWELIDQMSSRYSRTEYLPNMVFSSSKAPSCALHMLTTFSWMVLFLEATACSWTVQDQSLPMNKE